MLIGGGLFMALLLAICFYGMHQTAPKYEEKEAEAEKYYSKYAIVLKGIITGKKPAAPGAFTTNSYIYTVKIASCNVSGHDLREYNEEYYLVIKNDTAWFKSHFMLTGDTGDSIIINYIKRKQYTWKDQEALREHDLPSYLTVTGG